MTKRLFDGWRYEQLVRARDDAAKVGDAELWHSLCRVIARRYPEKRHKQKQKRLARCD